MSKPIAKHSDGSNCYTKGCSRGTHVSFNEAPKGIPSSIEFTASLLKSQEKQQTWKNLAKALASKYNQEPHPFAPDDKYDEINERQYFEMVDEIENPEDFHEAMKTLLYSQRLQDSTYSIAGVLAESKYCPKEVVFLVIRKGVTWSAVTSAIKNENLNSKDLSRIRALLVDNKTRVTEWGVRDAHYGFEQIANHPAADATVLHDLIIKGWQQTDVDHAVIRNHRTSASTLLHLSLQRPDRVSASSSARLALHERNPEILADFLGPSRSGNVFLDNELPNIPKAKLKSHIASLRTKYEDVLDPDVLDQSLTQLERHLSYRF